MAVSLRIIKLTRQIDEGDYRAWEQLKALAKTDPDAKRVLKTVKEPKKPISAQVKQPPIRVQETPQQVAEKAKSGDASAISSLRKKAEYEDSRAQYDLAVTVMDSDPDEARKWLIRSCKLPESMLLLKSMASKGDQKAADWLASHEDKGMVPRVTPKAEDRPPVRDELGYIRPPSSHKKCRIGDVYRINDAKLQTGQKNTMVLIKEMKGDFVTVYVVTREPGKHKAVRLMDPSIAGFASPLVYVLTDSSRVYKKDGLAEYRGSLSDRDAKQFRLSV